MGNLRSYISLFRVSNLPTVWSNATAAVLLCAVPIPPRPFLALLLSMSLMYSAGMALNDLCDLAVDRVQRPDRPIPAGRIGLLEARVATLLLFLVAFLLLALLPHPAHALGAGALLAAVIVLYDLRHKQNPFSVLLMAGCRLLVFVAAGLGMTGKLPGPVLALGLIQFCYIVAVSLTARCENSRPGGFGFPLIPRLLAAICLVDGAFVAAALGAPLWLLAGAGATLLTCFGQRYVRGD